MVIVDQQDPSGPKVARASQVLVGWPAPLVHKAIMVPPASLDLEVLSDPLALLGNVERSVGSVLA